MLINIQNLSYAIGERQLYKNLNMIVEDTDKIALVGVNGTGKSTLLKMIARHESPAITYEKGLKIAYLSQNPVFRDNETILNEAKYILKDVPEYSIKSSLTRFGFRRYEPGDQYFIWWSEEAFSSRNRITRRM